MRNNIYRGVLALAVALAVSAPAYAQNIVTGTVTGPNGEPVEGATVTLLNPSDNRTFEVVTDAGGTWMQIGVPAATYNMTIVKDDLTLASTITTTPGRNAFSHSLAPASEDGGVNAQLAAALGSAALEAGDNETAILRFTEVLGVAPDCLECHYNVGLAHMNLRQYDDAIAAFQQVVALDPLSVDGFNGLASVYNATRQFDLAAEASARASELAGADPAAAGSADALFNQGVIFFNAGQMADAQTQFQNTIELDPGYADAYYQLGMASLNLGQIPQALEAFEGYLEVAPDGPRAAEVQGFVQQLGAIQ